jgi:hypothetical protein
MAGRRSPVSDIREILRRLQLGERARRIARDLEVSCGFRSKVNTQIGPT